MTLDELLETVARSNRSDWRMESCWGARSGPSYRDHFSEGLDGEVVVDSHSNIAAYKPDLSITIAWGLDCSDNFGEEWTKNFTTPEASSSYLDFFYNNALVFRDVFVTVDGARARLPVPKIEWDSDRKNITGYTVPLRRYKIIRLLDSMEKISEFDYYFEQSEFTLTEGEWPE
jgi:hypothetical protein